MKYGDKRPPTADELTAFKAAIVAELALPAYAGFSPEMKIDAINHLNACANAEPQALTPRTAYDKAKLQEILGIIGTSLAGIPAVAPLMAKVEFLSNMVNNYAGDAFPASICAPALLAAHTPPISSFVDQAMLDGLMMAPDPNYQATVPSPRIACRLAGWPTDADGQMVDVVAETSDLTP